MVYACIWRPHRDRAAQLAPKTKPWSDFGGNSTAFPYFIGAVHEHHSRNLANARHVEGTRTTMRTHFSFHDRQDLISAHSYFDGSDDTVQADVCYMSRSSD